MRNEFEETVQKDIQAEVSVLGSMLLSPNALGDVLGFLSSRDFYNPKNQAIFDITADLYARGFPADVTTVSAELRTPGTFTAGADQMYVLSLIQAVPSSSSAMYYANIVAEFAERRRLIEAGTRIVQLAQDSPDAMGALAASQEQLDNVPSRRSAADMVHIADVVPEVLEEVEQVTKNGLLQGLSTGIVDLDHTLSGMRPGQLIIIAGRPATGKSTLAVNILQDITIRQGVPGVMFSLEMDKNELTTRVLSAEAGVLLSNLRSGEMDEKDWGKIERNLEKIVKAPMYIDDTPTVTPTDVRARARRMINKHRIGLIVVDYMQLMVSGKKVESRQQEVSAFSREMKIMAKELGIPVIVLSQLNRNAETRTDKTPALADLRESGSLEQDADIVILVHRPDLYEKESPRAGEVDLIVAKNRNGPVATVTCAARLHYSCFTDMYVEPKKREESSE